LERQINPLPLQSQSEHIPSHIPGTVSQLHQYESQPSLVNELDHVNNQNIPQSFLETSKGANHSELSLQHEQQILLQTPQINQEMSSSQSALNLQQTFNQGKFQNGDVPGLDNSQVQSPQNKLQEPFLEVQQQFNEQPPQQQPLQQQHQYHSHLCQSSAPLSNVPSVSYPVQQQQQQQAFPTFHPLLLALGTSQLQSPIFQSLHMQQQQQVNQSHVTPIQSAHMQPFFTPQYMQQSLLPQNVSMSVVFPGVFPGSSIAQQFNYPVIPSPNYSTPPLFTDFTRNVSVFPPVFGFGQQGQFLGDISNQQFQQQQLVQSQYISTSTPFQQSQFQQIHQQVHQQVLKPQQISLPQKKLSSGSETFLPRM
jgi:hypothetical protein